MTATIIPFPTPSQAEPVTPAMLRWLMTERHTPDGRLMTVDPHSGRCWPVRLKRTAEARGLVRRCERPDVTIYCDGVPVTRPGGRAWYPTDAGRRALAQARSAAMQPDARPPQRRDRGDERA